MGSNARHSRAEVSCANGHKNPAGQYFCGECGDLLEPAAVVCAVGHANPDDQRFCGECGAPLVPPPGVEPNSSAARWSVDPTGCHQYRYWDGVKWTKHVADGGKLAVHRYGNALGRMPESWMGLAAGLVTLLLLIGAGIDIWIQLSRDSATKSDTAASSTTSAPAGVASSAPTSTQAAPDSEVPTARPLVVIATPCRPNSSSGTTADGSVAYCERLQNTETYLWSLYPGDIPVPEVEGGSDPVIGVCMVQTNRTQPDCVEYLKRPSDPGDGGVPPDSRQP